jgi:head-tail adaptor
MRAGQLDQSISFSFKDQTQDATGGLVIGLSDVGTFPCRVISQKGQAAINAASTDIGRSIRIQMRPGADIELGQYALWNNSYYVVTDVDRTNTRHGELWLTATAREPG